MKRKSMKNSSCPVSRSLDEVGDWWSLLIVRDAYAGLRRFSEFEHRLGIPKNVLACRLKTLVGLEILRVEEGQNGRKDYLLTEKGRELRPVLDALSQWGRDHLFDQEELTKLDHAMAAKRNAAEGDAAA